MSDPSTETPYVQALRREAAGYIAREKWEQLAAVNRELEANGVKAIPRPGGDKSKPARSTPKAKR